MIFIIVSIFFLGFTSVIFYSSNAYNAFNNSFYALDYTLPNQWVVTDIEGKLEKPLYDTHLVEETSIQHFKNNLAGYVNKFEVGFYYFDSETLVESKERYVTGVRLSLKASVPFFDPYYKANVYLIHQGE